jgi:hypothetical protein
MVNRKEILRLLAEQDIPAVLIGGLALRIYGSPRPTRDMDLAIRSLDAGRVVELMYQQRFTLISAAGRTHATIVPREPEAREWAEQADTRSLAFVRTARPGVGGRVPLRELDGSSQVYFYFDLAIPVMRMRQHARRFDVDRAPMLVACPEDLLELKRRREPRSPADQADIAFLEQLLRKA